MRAGGRGRLAARIAGAAAWAAAASLPAGGAAAGGGIASPPEAAAEAGGQGTPQGKDAPPGPAGAESPDALLGQPLAPLAPGPPVPPPEPAAPEAAVLAPLPPLEGFAPDPAAGLATAGEVEAAISYEVAVLGLADIGLERTWKSLSRLWRGRGRETTPTELANRVRGDTQMTERLLQSEGYFAGRAEGRVLALPEAGGRTRARAEIAATPGPRYTWAEIALEPVPEDRPEVAARFLLSPGMPIRAADVEEAEGAHLLALAEAGHPFASIGARDVVLDDASATGTYYLAGDPGPRAVFGPIRMTGHRPFGADHAARLARFRPGDPYAARLVDDFRRAVIATQLFGGVTVSAVDSGARTAAGEAVAEIRVDGQPGPRRRTLAQLGYSPGEGFRAEIVWLDRNLWPPEGALQLRGVAGTEEQSARAEIVKRNFRRRDRRLGLLAGAANESRPAFDAQTLTLAATLAYETTPLWQKRLGWSVGAELVGSLERDAGIPRRPAQPGEAPRRAGRQFFTVAALPLSLLWDMTDDLLDPTRGFRLGVRGGPEVSRREDGASAAYLRLIAEGSLYRAVAERLVLAARARAGTLVGADLLSIAPTRRLYAGGGGSVRGYAFQGIGPVGSVGRPLGGRGLVDGSVEARYRVRDFGIVGFLDAGQLVADSAPSLAGLRAGYGLGLRYFTGLGPFRVDVARPFARRPGDPQVALYISIGQAF